MQYYPGEKYGQTRIIEGKIGEQNVFYRMTNIVDDNDNTISYRYTLLDQDNNFEPYEASDPDNDSDDIDDIDDDTNQTSFTSKDNFIRLLNFRVSQQQTGGRKRRRKSHKKRKSSRRSKSIRKMKSRRRK